MLGGLIPGLRRCDIAVDLGTSKTALFVRGEGVVYDQPSLVALRHKRSGKPFVIAVGHDALQIEGKEPKGVQTLRPLSWGVVEKVGIAKIMLREASRQAGIRRGMIKPRVLIGAPYAISDIERRAVREAALALGASSVELIEEPLAAAIGAEVDISESVANMVVDVGGGITEVVVISLGGIVLSESVRVGGDTVNQVLISFLRRQYNVIIGDQTAARIKEALCHPKNPFPSYLTVKGSCAESRLPQVYQICTTDLRRALEGPLATITATIKRALEKTPPILAGDLVDRGILLTGGSALLHGLREVIASEVKIPVQIAQDTRSSVIRGVGRVIEFPNRKA